MLAVTVGRGWYNESSTERRRPPEKKWPVEVAVWSLRSILDPAGGRTPTDLRQGPKAGLRDLQGHNNCYGGQRSNQRLNILPYGGSAARTTLWPRSTMACSHPALPCGGGGGRGGNHWASRWPTWASNGLAAPLKRTYVAKNSAITVGA